MTLAEKLVKIKESEIYKLTFEGKVLGLRVKFFDANQEKFLYYDFSLDAIQNKDMIRFIKSIKGMRSIALYRDGNGLLVSREEVLNKLIIQEFDSDEAAVRVLEPLTHIYAAKEG